MPPGYVHHNIWRRYLKYVPLISAGLVALHWQLGLGFLLGYLLGYYLDPDLDQISITSSEGRILNDFKIFGAVLLGFWLPYAYLHKHRGSSHWPIIGTVVRYVYLGLGILLLVRPSAEDLWRLQEGLYFILGLCLGTSFSDVLHSGADFGWIKIKRIDRRKP